MKNYLLFIALLFFLDICNGQDVVFSLEAQYEGVATEVDSIRINNLSNGTSLLLSDLPDQTSYEVNLTEGELYIPDIGNDIQRYKTIRAISIRAGEISILNAEKDFARIELAVYSITGTRVFSRAEEWRFGESKQISINRNGIYIVTIKSPEEYYSYKAIGLDRNGDVGMESSFGHQLSLKAQHVDSGFSFSLGDSLEILVYKTDYYADPVIVVVDGDGNIVINLTDPISVFKDERDGKEYAYVTIGTQVWMAENLAYNAGDGCWAYNNNESNVATYGRLYNWNTATHACPGGWHLPGDDEWKQLEMYIGMSQSEADDTNWRGTDEGKKLKVTSGWNGDGNGTDDYGFSALPGAYRSYNGSFDGVGYDGSWWSATESGSSDAWGRELGYNNSDVGRYSYRKEAGFSVRCLKDEMVTTVPMVTVEEATDITETTVTLHGAIVNDGGGEIFYRGFYWSRNNPDPGFDDLLEIAEVTSYTFSITITDLEPNTNYYFRTVAANSEGTGVSEVKSFRTKEMKATGTFTDNRDGQEYKYLTIGNQVWMAENLAYLPSVSPSSAESYTEPYYYVYDYQGSSVSAAKATDKYETYGVLYNWPAATNACPSGWHLPNDTEWTELTDYLGGLSIAGGKLKETGTTHWSNPNTGATNETGFGALPGGERWNIGRFYGIGSYSIWWSATENGSSYAWYWSLSCNNPEVYRDYVDQDNGSSVRCLKGEMVATVPSVNSSNIGTVTTTSCVLNGIVNSDGGESVTACGFYWSETNQEPGPGDQVISLDGKTGDYSYTLTGLKSNTTYYYRAFATNTIGTGLSDVKTFTTDITSNSGIFTDVRDGNEYAYVTIGNQVWMAENLAYLPSVSPSSSGSKTEPHYYVYDYQGTSVNAAKAIAHYETYGVLYNWPAATNACPSGWHLPIDEEWKQLEMYIGMSQSEADATAWRGTNEGIKLKASSGWNSNGNGTDEYGFSALPSGERFDSGIFYYVGEKEHWWSTSEDGLPWIRYLYYQHSDVGRGYGNREYGFSVRCVRD